MLIVTQPTCKTGPRDMSRYGYNVCVCHLSESKFLSYCVFLDFAQNMDREYIFCMRQVACLYNRKVDSL